MITENTAHEAIDLATEEHYSPRELADRYHVSVDTIIRWFRNVPGVIAVPSGIGRKKTMRIPKTSVQWFHEHQRSKK